MKLTASKLDLAAACLHSFTLRLPPDRPGPAAQFGTRFHALAAAYIEGKPVPVPLVEPELKTMFEGWAREWPKHAPLNPRIELAYAMNPDGRIRFLGSNIERAYTGGPYDVYASIDVVGSDKFCDHKTGQKRGTAETAWQLRFAAVCTGLSAGEFQYVDRSGRIAVDRGTYTAERRADDERSLLTLSNRLASGDTAPTAGAHCDTLYCPARKQCAAYAATKITTQQKETVTMGKMTLGSVTKGRVETPLCLALYSPEGCGKSTFASQAPLPIFIGEKDGTAHLDVARFPVPGSWVDVLEAIDALQNEKHTYQTFVIDTADYLEPLIYAHVCANGGKASIEDFGYGKGYVLALDQWRILVTKLDQLREKGMHVIVLAHSQVKTFRNPTGDDFDKFEMKLHAKAAALLKEWPNAVLFANYRTYIHEKEGRIKALGDGSRVMYTEHRPAFDAKNRYGLPFELPLSWGEFERAARAHKPADPAALKAQAGELIELLADKEEAIAALGRCGDDAIKLAMLVDWLRGKVSAAA